MAKRRRASGSPANNQAIADEKSRAVGMLLGYLRSRFRITNPTVVAAFKKNKEVDVSTKADELIERAREGRGSLSAPEVAGLTHCLVTLMSEPERAAMLEQDYPLIRCALEMLQIDIDLFTHHDDQSPLDREFLQALNVGYLNLQNPLYDRIVGFWHVIRESSDNDSTYNVSLLSIKRLKYTAKILGKDQRKTSLIPHFSLRSRLKESRLMPGEIPQTYHGRVVIDGNDIHFIGNQDDSTKFVAMTWKNPQIYARGAERHIDAVPGLINTINADDRIITMPLVAQFIKSVPREVRSLYQDYSDHDTSDAERAMYDAEVESGIPRIGKWRPDDLMAMVGDFGLATPERLLSELTELINSGEGRYFKL